MSLLPSSRVTRVQRQEAKRTKVDLSVPALFRDLAAGWIKKEMNWYGSQADYKPIDNQGKEKVDAAHLKKACKEYKERFTFCTEEEDVDCFSGSPYLLVATNVKSTWEAPDAPSVFRFAIFPMQEENMSALFIVLMPGPIHGSIDGTFASMIGAYMEGVGVDEDVDECHSGGGTYQPGISIAPDHPDPNPLAGVNDYDTDCSGPQRRVVVEFELGNRNASAIREVGHTVLSQHYGSLFVGIKVWKKESAGARNAGCFGAALIVWEKNHTTGVVDVRSAFDFGTKALSIQTKNAWNTGTTPMMLPPVPVGAWVRPPAVAPGPVNPGIPAGWALVLPSNALFYRMPLVDTPVPATLAGAGGAAGAGAPLYLTALNIPNLTINLNKYQRKINKHLDKM